MAVGLKYFKIGAARIANLAEEDTGVYLVHDADSFILKINGDSVA